jgi:cell division initiation protein
MTYSPVELRHVRPPKAVGRGYRRRAVDELLIEVADSFETVWRERGELADKVEDLEQALEDLRARERLLATTLVSAQKAAADAKAQAHKDAELIVAEAHTEARSIIRTAQNERERLFAEARRVEALLRSALGMVQEADFGDPDAEAPDADESWPKREDTREFRGPTVLVRAEQEASAG